MPLEKIGEVRRPCNDPDHNPPSMIVLPDGVYRHTCPSCGSVVVFTVASPSC